MDLAGGMLFCCYWEDGGGIWSWSEKGRKK